MFGNLTQVLLLNVCRPILLIVEFVFDQGEMLLSLVHERVREGIWTDPNKQVVTLLPKISVMSSLAKSVPYLIRKWRISSKRDGAVAIDPNYRLRRHNFGNLHWVIVA